MKVTFFSFLIILTTSQLFAQKGVLNRMVDRTIDRTIDRTAQKVEDRMNQKLDTLVDKKIDQIENSSKQSKSSKVTKERGKSTQIEQESNSVSFEPFAEMSLSVQMEFPTKSKDNMLMNYYFKGEECAFEMMSNSSEKGMDRMIMNMKQMKSTMLMTDKKGNKTGMVMDLNGIGKFAKTFSRDQESSDKVVKDFDLKETNEYKTIEGYKCRKYVHEEIDYTHDYWMTKEVIADYSKIKSALSNSFSTMKSSNMFSAGVMNGMIIQIHAKPKTKKGTESITTFKRIKMGSVPNEKFSTVGYQLTSMPSLSDMFNRSNE